MQLSLFRRYALIMFATALLLFSTCHRTPQVDSHPANPSPTEIVTPQLPQTPDGRLEQQLAVLPDQLAAQFRGKWAVLGYDVQKTNSITSPFSSVVFLHFGPQDSAELHTYRLRLVYQHDAWHLTSAEDSQYNTGDDATDIGNYDDHPHMQLYSFHPVLRELKSLFP